MREEYETILIQKQAGVAKITLNRPENLNAQSPQMMDEMNSALDEIEKDEATKVLVISGAGRAFCAGGDIELDVGPASKMSPFEFREFMKKYYYGVIRKIYHMEKPIIAAINGVAAGGGCDLVMACDIRIASEKANFVMGFIRLGLIADMGGNYFLPRLVGMGKAKLLSLLGEVIDARYAEQIGLVDRVVPEGEFANAVDQLANKLAKGPRLATALYKQAMHRSSNMDLDTSLTYSVELQGILIKTEDFKEGLASFLEKREPNFKGK